MSYIRIWGHSEPEIHWPASSTNVAGKIVLDLGCGSDGFKSQEPWISTIEHWNNLGAAKIVGVELNSQDVEMLQEKFRGNHNILIYNDAIKNVSQVRDLISKHDVQIIKSDIEGWEEVLLNLSDEEFSGIQEYYIETHDDISASIEDTIYHRLMEKFVRCGYVIRDQAVFQWTPRKYDNSFDMNINLIFAYKK
jgi:hypothetical protein